MFLDCLYDTFCRFSYDLFIIYMGLCFILCFFFILCIFVMYLSWLFSIWLFFGSLLLLVMMFFFVCDWFGVVFGVVVVLLFGFFVLI